MSTIFDIAVVAIVVLLIFLGYKRGFIRTVFNFIGYIAAAVLAFLLGNSIAELIFNSFFRSRAVELINSELSKAAGGQSISEMIQRAFAAIPENIRAFVPEGAISQIEQGLTQSTPTTTDVSEAIVSEIIGPIAIMILQLLLFVILFIILCIVVKLVTRQLKFIDKIPFVGTANSVLGLVIGLAEAVIFLFLFTSIAAMLIQLSGNQWTWLNSSVVEDTLIFKLIYAYNPFIQLK